MPVEPLTAASSKELIALATVKAKLSIADDSEDESLSEAISFASAEVMGLLQFPLGRARYQEERCGTGERQMYLSRLPMEPESLTVEIDGEEVTDWRFLSAEWGRLYRRDGWPRVCDEEPNLKFTYYAGYLLPNDVSDWEETTSYTAGEFVRPESPSLLRYECTTAGTSGGSGPTWPDEAGDTVTDGSVTWTARRSTELPEEVQNLAYGFVLLAHERWGVPDGTAAVDAEGTRTAFFSGDPAQHLKAAVAAWAAGRGTVAS